MIVFWTLFTTFILLKSNENICYPFGMVKENRNYTSFNYRYGFNGKEKDNEVKGDGNSYDFGERIHDSRLGRWMSLDPSMAKFPFVSPYVYTNNNPIIFIDILGREWVNGYTAKVQELQKSLVDNPDDKKLKKQLKEAQTNETKVNDLLTKLKTSDEALYNYVDNLKIKDNSGNEVNVKVNLYVDDASQGSGGQVASTSYVKSGDGVTPNTKYGEKDIVAPISTKTKKVGFDVTVYGNTSFGDERLSNEIGDIMYYMEYNDVAVQQKGDNKIFEEKSGDAAKNEYMKEGGAGEYSYRVQSKYTERKKSGEGKDTKKNPYPLSRTTKK